MAIDASIYNKIQPHDIQGAVEKGMSMRDMIDQRNKKRATDEAFKSGIIQNADGTVSIDANQTVSSLAGVDPQAAMKFKQEHDAQTMAQEKAKMERQMQEVDLISRIAPNVKDQGSYEQALSTLQKFGVDISKMPQAYDPGLVQQYYGMALSAKDRMAQSNADRDFGLKREELNIKRGEAKTKATQEGGKLATELRKERSGLPVTKATQDVATAYNKVQKAAAIPSAAGDMSMIFGYMKMLDPGSTVREGEFANAQQATGVPTQVLNYYNRALKGERLAPEQRADFLNQAGNLYQSQIDVQNQVDAQFSALAQKSGIDPKEVILDFKANTPLTKKDLTKLPDDDIDALYSKYGGK